MKSFSRRLILPHRHHRPLAFLVTEAQPASHHSPRYRGRSFIDVKLMPVTSHLEYFLQKFTSLVTSPEIKYPRPRSLILPPADSDDVYNYPIPGKSKSLMRSSIFLSRECGVKTDSYPSPYGSPPQQQHPAPNLFTDSMPSSTVVRHTIHSSNSDCGNTAFSPNSNSNSPNTRKSAFPYDSFDR
jgi:hypothetical protein